MAATVEYAGGLFGFMNDLPLCLCSIFCCPWIHAKITAKSLGQECNHCHCPCFNPYAPFWHRKDYGKQTGLIADFFDLGITIFCMPCSVCQNARAAGVKPFELG
jgi:hypothetical protein